MKKLLIAFLFIFSTHLYAQEDVNYIYKGYQISSKFDTALYCSSFSITKGSTTVTFDSCTERLEEVKEYDFEGDGNKILVLTYFTGGAHCCEYMVAADIKNDKYVIYDTLWWGDSGHEVKDIDKDGKLEISGVDTRYGYAFTNFAQSRFPIVIFRYRNGKFHNVTKNYPAIVEADMKDLKKELNDDYLKKGYECPPANEESFNTDAGAVQALLAAILADYCSLNKGDDGYDYIDKVYKCKDKKKFIATLKNDYKLK